MSSDLPAVRRVFSILYLISSAIVPPAVLLPALQIQALQIRALQIQAQLVFAAQPVSAVPQSAAPQSPQAPISVQSQAPEGQLLIRQALAAELQAAQDSSHPMRYTLRKSSPRLTTTKQIVETRDGDVARLISIDDRPLSPAGEQQEQARLDQLLADPALQRHRKQSEDADAGHALKVLRALPNAFLYEDAGPAEDPSGTPSTTIEKFTFRPNPSFSPPDLESQFLTQMSGYLTIDLAQKRVVRLESHLQQDVDFGWGILGRLNKGGWIAIDQADVGGGQWRTVKFQMLMSGRVVFKSRTFDTVEEQTHFAPVPSGLSYRDAIQLLRTDSTLSDPSLPQPANAKRP